MIYAIKNNERVKAIHTGEKAHCPVCSEEVISKCGHYMINHWAHKKDSNCSYKPMSEFHIMVQSLFPESTRERLSINSDKEKHIADIEIGSLVIEVQNSPINREEIYKRNSHHKTVLWVLNSETYFGDSFYLKRDSEGDLCVYLRNRRNKKIFNFQGQWFYLYKNGYFYKTLIDVSFDDASRFSYIGFCPHRISKYAFYHYILKIRDSFEELCNYNPINLYNQYNIEKLGKELYRDISKKNEKEIENLKGENAVLSARLEKANQELKSYQNRNLI
jgi:hypothetical protein